MAGRKPGGPKTGGRKKGTPNKVTASIRDAARAHTADALGTLVAVMGDIQAPAAARVSAANAILDRGYGKPMQALEHTGRDGAPIEAHVLTAEQFEAAAKRIASEI